MTTNARPTTQNGAHFYLKDGTPFYEVPYADPSKGMRKATLADARKVGALPSVTTILRVIDKPALTAWLIEQAVLTAVTAPKLPGETLDAFIERVLHTEKQQDAEAQKARDLGTDIHDAMEAALQGRQVSDEIAPYIRPAVDAVKSYGEVKATEKVIIGNGYAGRADLIQETQSELIIWDFKTTKSKLPKESYPEHKIQLSAYAYALNPYSATKTINLYISTTEIGKYVVCENPTLNGAMATTFSKGFMSALCLWEYMNNYSARQ